jgi:hypothetical protein
VREIGRFKTLQGWKYNFFRLDKIPASYSGLFSSRAHAYAHIYAHMHTCMHTCARAHTHAHTRTYVHTGCLQFCGLDPKCFKPARAEVCSCNNYVFPRGSQPPPPPPKTPAAGAMPVPPAPPPPPTPQCPKCKAFCRGVATKGVKCFSHIPLAVSLNNYSSNDFMLSGLRYVRDKFTGKYFPLEGGPNKKIGRSSIIEDFYDGAKFRGIYSIYVHRYLFCINQLRARTSSISYICTHSLTSALVIN